MSLHRRSAGNRVTKIVDERYPAFAADAAGEA
jgi:hypothetical protein